MFSLPNYMTDDRLETGYVIVLPGIEGYSYWNKSIVRGLVSAGVTHGIEIHDWTCGRLLTLYNFFARSRQREQSRLIAEKILAYRSRYPDRPVTLIGHSGGGAMTVLTLERLPRETLITQGILIGAALSRHYDLRPALERTTRGITNISSWGDVLFLGASTLSGNIDRRWTFAAGLSGFSPVVHDRVRESNLPPLVEVPYTPRFALARNFGGHFGGVATPFVRRHIAPVLLTASQAEDAPPEQVQIQMG